MILKCLPVQSGRLFGQMWVRFGIVGVCATASYYLLGILFVYFLRIPILIGNFFAYASSFAVSYLGQSLWTFHAKGKHGLMLARFAITQGIGLCINTAIIEICARVGIAYELAMLAAIVIVPIFVYFICKIWVFPNSDKAGA